MDLKRAWDLVWTNDPVDTIVGGFLILGLASVLLVLVVGAFFVYVV